MKVAIRFYCYFCSQRYSEAGNCVWPKEASAYVEALVRAARSSTHEKADYYAAILDELKGWSNALSPSAYKRPLILGDSVRAKLQRSPLRFASLFKVKSLGFKVVTVPARLGTNALMFTVRLIAIHVAYQGISPGLVAANAAAETLSVSKWLKYCVVRPWDAFFLSPFFVPLEFM